VNEGLLKGRFFPNLAHTAIPTPYPFAKRAGVRVHERTAHPDASGPWEEWRRTSPPTRYRRERDVESEEPLDRESRGPRLPPNFHEWPDQDVVSGVSRSAR